MRIALLGLCVLLAVSCGRSDSQTILDDGPRVPDAEGVVDEIQAGFVRLQGNEPYRISTAVESFTSRGHEVTALLSWKGKYVHLGLDDEKRVVWIAGIGVVVRPQNAEASVLYAGVFERVDRGRAVFRDGTTLKLDRGVRSPRKGAEVGVSIDPERKVVTRMTVQ